MNWMVIFWMMICFYALIILPILFILSSEFLPVLVLYLLDIFSHRIVEPQKRNQQYSVGENYFKL